MHRTIKEELVSVNIYIRDDVRKYRREEDCIFTAKHCSVKLF